MLFDLLFTCVFEFVDISLTLLVVITLDDLTNALSVLATIWWMSSCQTIAEGEDSRPIVSHTLVDDFLRCVSVIRREPANE